MVIVLQKIWEIFNAGDEFKIQDSKVNIQSEVENPKTENQFPFSIFLVGLFAGTLPLVHAHSLIVLFIVCAFLFVLSFEKWREWIAFGIGVGDYRRSGTCFSRCREARPKRREFIAWHFGWDKGETNFFWFWLKNTGIFIPLLLLGLYLIYFPQRRKDAKIEEKKIKGEKREKARSTSSANRQSQIANSFLPSVFILLRCLKLDETRTVGMGQHQGFDLLVCRLDSVCRFCAGVDVGKRLDAERRKNL